MLGLCARAGKLACGADMTAEAVRKGRAKLAVLDAQAAQNTRKLVENACKHYGVPLYTAEGLGHAVGKSGRMAVAVLDAGMAARVADLLDAEAN